MSAIAQLSRETILQSVLDAYGQPMKKDGVSLDSNLSQYNLEPTAKLLYPTYAPLVASTPRSMNGTGEAIHWKTIMSLNPGNVQGGLPQGKRNKAVDITAKDFSAPYASVGWDSLTTYEAQSAAQGFDDPRALMTKSLLQSAMVGEELICLGGNYNLQYAQASTPTTVSQSASGGAMTDGNHYIYVVALSLAGYRASTVVGGLPGQVTVTNVAGSVFSFGGGNGQISAALTLNMTGGGAAQSAIVKVAPTKGAVAYAWYWGTSTGAGATLGAITTTNRATLTTDAGAGTQAANDAAVAADYSTNQYVFNGYLTQLLGVGQETPAPTESGAYYASLDGAAFTSNGGAGLAEIDTALKSIYRNTLMSPQEAWMSASMVQKLTGIIIDNGGAPIVRYNMDASRADAEKVAGGQISAGAVVVDYLNPFGWEGNQSLRFRSHPAMPDGVVMLRATDILYPAANFPYPAQINVRRGWYQIEWPARERQYEAGTYIEEAFRMVYAPVMGVICDASVV